MMGFFLKLVWATVSPFAYIISVTFNQSALVGGTSISIDIYLFNRKLTNHHSAINW